MKQLARRPWAGVIAETDMQRAALQAWKDDAPLLYAKPTGLSRRMYPVEATAEAIQAAEARGLVPPDPITYRRARSIR